MFDLFDRTAEVSSAQYTPPNWQYIRSQLQLNIKKLHGFYGTFPTAVKADHILARLITAVAIPKTLELTRFYDNVQRVSMDVAMALFFTSSISFGRLHHRNFYNCHEVIIADFTPFDERSVHENWKNVSAVTVEYHPYTDLNMLLPEPDSYAPSNKIAFIKINIAALMVQYRAFRLSEEMITAVTLENERSLYQFIRMHVLPNMIYSHVDHAVLNRMTHLLQDQGMIPSTKKHSFHLIEESNKVDAALEQEVMYYSRAQRDFKTILHAVPLITRRRAIDLLHNPDIAKTQQVGWALQLMRLPSVKLLALLCPENVLRANKATANALILDLTKLLNSHMLRRMLPPAFAEAAELDVADILNIMGHPA